MRALIAWLLVACVGICVANQDYESSDLAPNQDVVAILGKIVNIKQMADETFFPSMEVEAQSLLGAATESGPSDSLDQADIEEHRMQNAKAEGLLAKAANLLGSHKDIQLNLGEGQNDSDQHAASELFAKLKSRNPHRVASTIRRVVSYFGGLAEDGKKLNQEEMDQARKWYIEATASVLGRWSYDDEESKVGVSGAHDVSGLKSRAVMAKRSMDRIDAARHMHKMGADQGMNHKGLNLLVLLERTGRLAQFLGAIEDSTALKNAEPMKMCSGLKCPPREAWSMIHRHMMDEEQQQMVDDHHHSKLQDLEKRESDITATINLLMKKVALGDPISGQTNAQIEGKEKKNIKAASKTADGELKAQLNAAAEKEDKARIVEAAGDVAEKKIMSTMHSALTKHHIKKQVKKSQRQDVSVPIQDLASHVAMHMNKGLSQILHLFKKRHRQHKHLTTSEHKRVSNKLREMAAHLMKVNTVAQKNIKTKKKMPVPQKTYSSWSPKAMKPPKTTKPLKVTKAPKAMPKAGGSVKSDDPAPKTWAHKGTVAIEQKAMDQGHAEIPSQGLGQFGKVARGAIVNKFIWATLGKRNSHVKTETPKTLAELLKNGVNLMNGGRLHFLLHP